MQPADLPVRFSTLAMAYRRALARAARRAHPHNKEHRIRWIRARCLLDAAGTRVRVSIGRGVIDARSIHELSQWDRAHRNAGRPSIPQTWIDDELQRLQRAGHAARLVC